MHKNNRVGLRLTRFLFTIQFYQAGLYLNFLGYTDKRNYPNNDFWQIVSEVKNDVVIGLDAHNPNVYDDKENLERAKKYLKSLNITPLDKIEL